MLVYVPKMLYLRSERIEIHEKIEYLGGLAIGVQDETKLLEKKAETNFHGKMRPYGINMCQEHRLP